MSEPASRILYIDDDQALCRLVQRALGRMGRQVVTAHDGDAGVRLARQGGFDAICLDHYMPGADGLETLGLLRDQPAPVIFVTGADETRVAVAALRAGAEDFVVKTPGESFLLLLQRAIDGAVDRAAMRRRQTEAEAQVRAALDRAEELAASRALLLQEVNHRVANSLQIIASLTRLQEGAVADPAARAALAAVRHRIAAVAQVHRRLYTSADVRAVALNDYLGGLLTEIGRSVETARIDFTGADLQVPPDRAVSLGVILSELVTNALKYAYPDLPQGGPIRVTLTEEDGAGVLRVEDDGIGGAGAHAPAGTGLGGRIVQAMAQTIGGLVEFAGGPGSRITVRFALN
ncbi:sensor histidine kinase [Falsiroseomonas selenitidurans]|uniref:histidine kinase n=1 Tax=Falsiroseomonas selenitidurans TaxID=2716335 RepID=A0ABX1E3J1_9PROT|nr:response regulator [Falsiroseomonas selenitidurans]NKC31333.1 response regulator [Falsiroseomonas selenitidurans]